MSKAEMTPGIDSGSVTRRNAMTGPSPRSGAASMSDRSIFSSETKIGRMAKAAQACASVTMTAIEL